MKAFLAAALLVASVASAQVGGRQPSDSARAANARNRGGGNCGQNAYNCVDAKNPIPTPNTVWMEEMTWMDVRDALNAGKTTAIIASGGMEPNGPWLATGKHNYVLQANCEAIARRLGNALCAPIVKFVPEGNWDPPTIHMASPGTISMREATFRSILVDIISSLRMHGFKQIFLIGDSGGNQFSQRCAADSLNALWHGDPLVAHIQEYYDYAGVTRYMEQHGIREDSARRDRLHDDPIISLNMYMADPKSIRFDERRKAGLASINGISLADANSNQQLGKAIVDYRSRTTMEAISKAIANKGTLPPPPSRNPNAQPRGCTIN